MSNISDWGVPMSSTKDRRPRRHQTISSSEPVKLEQDLNDVPGVVTVGLFAKRPADVLLLGTEDGVRTLT